MDSTGTSDDAGIRKAAVFVASLDATAADALLDRLGPQQAELVRQAMTELHEIDADEQGRVIEEFRRIEPLVPESSPAGIELDLLELSPLNRPASSATEEARNSPAEESAPFDFLRETADKSLVQLLGGERAPTVAMVLAHLPPERAGDLLASLPPALQTEVLRRLVDLENTDSETVREVEQALEARLVRQFAVERRREAGPEAACRILAFCEPETRGQILDLLAAENQDLAVRLGRRPPIDFDDLANLGDDALRTVLRAAETEVLSAALLGAPPALLRRFLQCVAPRKAKKLEARLAHLDPIRLSDVEEARRRIAALAQHLSCGESGRSVAA
jgi:flagellar motor switch protein FliG